MHEYLKRIDGLAHDAIGEFEASDKGAFARDVLIDRLTMCSRLRREVEKFEQGFDRLAEQMFEPRPIRKVRAP